MTCKDCLHYEVCKYMCYNEDVPFADPNRCINFHHQSRFVELPCEVGQKLYTEFITAPFGGKPTIIEYTVTEILFSSKRGVRPCVICCFGGRRFDNLDFGKTVFLSREEAENALKARAKG